MPQDFIPLEDARKTASAAPATGDFISLEDAKKQGWLDKPLVDTTGINNQVPKDKQIITLRDLFGPKGLITVLRGADPAINGAGIGAGMAYGAQSGSALGPYGALAGGVLGGAAASLATRHAIESLTGQSEPSMLSRLGVTDKGSIMDRLLGAFGDTAINMSGNKLFDMGTDALKSGTMKALNFLHPPAPVPAFNTPEFANVPASYSQLTGGTGEGLERLLGRNDKTALNKKAVSSAKQIAYEQVNKLAGQTGDQPIDVFDQVAKFKGNIQAGAEDLVQRSNKYAQDAKDIAKFNIVPQQTPMGPTPVKGPVYANDAVQAAFKKLQEFKARYGEVPESEMYNKLEADEKPLLTSIHEILRNANMDSAGNLVPDANGNISKAIPFDRAWDIKQSTAKLGKYDNTFATSQQGQFRSLSATLDDDIEASLAKWQNGGDAALKSYQRAKMIVAKRHELYQNGDTIQAILDPKQVMTKDMLEKVTESPEGLGRAIAAGRDRKVIQASEFQRLIENSWVEKDGKYDIGKLADQWTDPNKQAIYKKLYNADQRAALDNTIEVLKNVSQKQSNSGAYSSMFQIGRAAVYAGTGIVSWGLAQGGMNPYQIASGGFVGLAIGLHQFTKNVLLNPQVARQFAYGLKAPAQSQSGQFIGSTVLGALKGATIMLTKQDGSQTPATVQPNGGLKLD